MFSDVCRFILKWEKSTPEVEGAARAKVNADFGSIFLRGLKDTMLKEMNTVTGFGSELFSFVSVLFTIYRDCLWIN